MAGRERHCRQIGGVPSGDDQTAGKRIPLDFFHHRGNLVDDAPVRGLPRAPLLAIDGSEIAVLVRPFVPDADAMRLEIGDIGIAAQKPQKLVDDGFPVQLLGGDERKALAQGEPHLTPEKRAGSGPGAIGLIFAVAEYFGEKVEIGLHARTFYRLFAALGNSTGVRPPGGFAIDVRDITQRLSALPDMLPAFLRTRQRCRAWAD